MSEDYFVLVCFGGDKKYCNLIEGGIVLVGMENMKKLYEVINRLQRELIHRDREIEGILVDYRKVEGRLEEVSRDLKAAQDHIDELLSERSRMMRSSETVNLLVRGIAAGVKI